MNTAIIIQARLGSTRLPAKVLLPLPTRRTVLEEVVQRCCIAEDVVGKHVLTVVACPIGDERQIIANSGSNAVYGFYGDEDDVLSRYVATADYLSVDTIVRITADCPMIDPDTIAECIKLHEHSGADYTSNVWPTREFPKGWDVEVFSLELLSEAHEEATDSHDREHVTPIMQRWGASRQIKIACLKSHVDRSHIRCTLDTLEDYRNIWDMMSRDDPFA